MHTAEEVRDVAAIAETGLAYKDIAPMLLSYADLLEAMEEIARGEYPPNRAAILLVRALAAEKQKARKG